MRRRRNRYNLLAPRRRCHYPELSTTCPRRKIHPFVRHERSYELTHRNRRSHGPGCIHRLVLLCRDLLATDGKKGGGTRVCGVCRHGDFTRMLLPAKISMGSSGSELSSLSRCHARTAVADELVHARAMSRTRSLVRR